MTDDKAKYKVKCDKCKQLKGSLNLIRTSSGLKMLCSACVAPFLTKTMVPKVRLVTKKTPKVKGRKKK